MTVPTRQSTFVAKVDELQSAAYRMGCTSDGRPEKVDAARDLFEARAAVLAAGPGGQVTEDEQVVALADAMWQLLDDMGLHGKNVCGAAKASARIAYEPFADPEAPLDYPLRAALDIEIELDEAHGKRSWLRDQATVDRLTKRAALRVMPLAEERTLNGDSHAVLHSNTSGDLLVLDLLDMDFQTSTLIASTPPAQPAPDGAEALEKALERIAAEEPEWNKGEMSCGAANRMRTMAQQALRAYQKRSSTLAKSSQAIDAYRARHAAPSDSGGKRWRHKKHGTTYTEIGEADLQCDRPVSDYDVVVVYRADHDGRIWVRPKSEFEDGRFEELGRGAPPRTDADAAQREDGK